MWDFLKGEATRKSRRKCGSGSIAQAEDWLYDRTDVLYSVCVCVDLHLRAFSSNLHPCVVQDLMVK